MFHVLIQSTHINLCFLAQIWEKAGSESEATSFEWSYGDLLKLATLSPVNNGGLEDDFSLQEQFSTWTMTMEGGVGTLVMMPIFCSVIKTLVTFHEILVG